ncbi:MAG: oligopeptide transporter, OPT family [Phycisphaerae bacterium]
MKANSHPSPGESGSAHQPYIPDAQVGLAELSIRAILLGTVLGIVFGASSLYLLLKVGMTVSASVPIAVLSITFFRVFGKAFGRPATILENNIVQTTGSAGESIAFGVGVTMPALYLLGYEMDVTRVMTVSILGGLLGILMMIPLRRAFIVKQHGKLKYPEGTACAEVLIAGDKGGTTARMVFLGFGIAAVHKFCTSAMKLWSDVPEQALYRTAADGTRTGLKGAAISADVSPELLGVGFLLGPKIAGLMMSGAVLSYFVLGPLIATFGDGLSAPVPPATVLVRALDHNGLWANYLRYIGAGAVAAGGIISMCRALPLIWASIVSGLRDLRGGSGGSGAGRTGRDLSMKVVLFGSAALVVAMMAIPSLGLGFSPQGLLGAAMILLFGFLFVTVSSRLTGEVGSSSNPISGMTIATLLMTCLVFLLLGRTGASSMLTVLTVAAVVCIASSNGGTTSQDLKTGFLVGATPRAQQVGIVVGAVTSAIVIGVTLLLMNAGRVHYTTKDLPASALTVPGDAPTQRVGRPYAEKDTAEYRIVHVRAGQVAGVRAGRYLVDAAGHARYRTDLPIARELTQMDNGVEAPKAFAAPQPQLFSSIIEGILGGTLQWGMVIIGALIAVALELAGLPALPVAVGMYIPLYSTTPLFAGGVLRWICDKMTGVSASESETETGPGVLLSSGYIAGGTLCGLIVTFFAFMPDGFNRALDLGSRLGHGYAESGKAKVISLLMFGGLAAVLTWIGSRRPASNGGAKR